MKIKLNKKQALSDSKFQIKNSIIHDKDYEIIKPLSQNIETIMDVGANRGQSIISFKNISDQFIIHSFEINPALFHNLRKVADSYQRVYCYEVGLGFESGETILNIPIVGGSPLWEEASIDIEHYNKPWIQSRYSEMGGLNSIEQYKAKIVKGDDYDIAPQVIKIDVEGAESIVIKGLEKTIVRHKPLMLVENSDWQNVTDLLSPLGYSPYRIFPEELKVRHFYGETTNTLYIHYEMLEMVKPILAES